MIENTACERRGGLSTVTGRNSPGEDQHMKQCKLTVLRVKWENILGVFSLCWWRQSGRQVDKAISLTYINQYNMLKSCVKTDQNEKLCKFNQFWLICRKIFIFISFSVNRYQQVLWVKIKWYSIFCLISEFGDWMNKLSKSDNK